MKQTPIELNTSQTVLVLGGNGFIGRHIVAHLENLGAEAIIGTRGTRPLRDPATLKIRLQDINSAQDWQLLLDGIDVVVNAVGILRQRWSETYQQIHYRAVQHLATACEARRIRLVHISILGIQHPVSSRLVSSKRSGEHAVMNSGADWHIVRPSLLDGEGGYGAKWFRRVAQWPIHLSPANANALLAPIDVGDVGQAVARIALSDGRVESDKQRIYELGGAQQFSVLEYLQVLRGGLPAMRIRIPAWIARPVSHLFDLLHFSPFSFGHYQLLQFDNCPAVNRTEELLGRAASIKPRVERNTANSQTPGKVAAS